MCQRLGVNGFLPGRVLHPAAGVVVEEEVVGGAQQRLFLLASELRERRHQLLERVRVVPFPGDAAEDGLGVEPELRVEVPPRRGGVLGVRGVERLGPLRVEVDADEAFLLSVVALGEQRPEGGDGPGVREQDVVRDDPGLDVGVASGLAGFPVGAAPRGVDADVVAAELGGGRFFRRG